MKRMHIGLLAAIGLIALAAVLDLLAFAEEFGLWTYTLGTIAGLGLSLLGLLIALGKLLFSRRKNIVVGAMFIFIGLATFLFALLIRTAAGRPKYS